MKDQAHRGTFTRRNTNRGDLRLKKKTYGETCTRREHLHGSNIQMKEKTHAGTNIRREHIHVGHIS